MNLSYHKSVKETRQCRNLKKLNNFTRLDVNWITKQVSVYTSNESADDAVALEFSIRNQLKRWCTDVGFLHILTDSLYPVFEFFFFNWNSNHIKVFFFYCLFIVLHSNKFSYRLFLFSLRFPSTHITWIPSAATRACAVFSFCDLSSLCE